MENRGINPKVANGIWTTYVSNGSGIAVYIAVTFKTLQILG